MPCRPSISIGVQNIQARRPAVAGTASVFQREPSRGRSGAQWKPPFSSSKQRGRSMKITWFRVTFQSCIITGRGISMGSVFPRGETVSKKRVELRSSTASPSMHGREQRL